MLGRHRKSRQLDIFAVPMDKYLDPEHDLVVTGQKIDWVSLEKEFRNYYSDKGRPSVPLRKIIGLSLLKSRFNLSEEKTLEIWTENPYWQHFCGEVHFQHDKPFSAAEFGRFRKRVGETGQIKIQWLSAEYFGLEEDTRYQKYSDQKKTGFIHRLFSLGK